MAYINWRIDLKWPVTCDECRKETRIYQKYEVRWAVGYDWEDGETFYTCPLCILKGKLSHIKFLATRELRALRDWREFNREIAPKTYSYLKYRKILMPRRW